LVTWRRNASKKGALLINHPEKSIIAGSEIVVRVEGHEVYSLVGEGAGPEESISH
jgi:hypothetical protein